MLRGPATSRKIRLVTGDRWGTWLLWEPRDLWIGVFWNLDCTHGDLYICLIPTLPFLLRWLRRPKDGR